ncbi:hypothetical protein [Geoglobus acetivorans]|uniref:Cbb3-type cytochrome c oxidase subunit I n=1 Tax=Geoglobus acetivorans TaxID=565033 RepID=A0ABZ3H1B4_GEOAI|nr:hypothetical protein [Geoglobus acetivorans]
MGKVFWDNLPLRFIYTGLIYLIVSSLAGILGLMEFPVRPLHSHMMLAGFVSLTIIGSMYQLVPTVTGTELKLRNLAEISYYLVNAGILLLIASFVSSVPFSVSGMFYLAGAISFAVVVVVTLRYMRLKSPAVPFFVMSVAFYLAGILYATLAFSGITSFSIWAHSYILMAGWVGITTFGGLYELFPMLSLRKLRSTGLAYATLPMLIFSVLVVSYGYHISEKSYVWLGKAVFSLAFTILVINLVLTLSRKSETPAPLDISVKFFIPALLFGLVGAFADLFGIEWYSVSHLYLVGWVTLTIIGAEYHIIPMISWMDKYSAKLGLEEVPMIADLFNESLAKILLLLSVVGALLIVWDAGRLFGGIILFAVFLLFTFDMIMVQRR